MVYTEQFCIIKKCLYPKSHSLFKHFFLHKVHIGLLKGLKYTLRKYLGIVKNNNIVLHLSVDGVKIRYEDTIKFFKKIKIK